MTRSFFGFSKPCFEYELLTDTLPVPEEIAAPATVTLLLPEALEKLDSGLIKIGDKVKTGQKLVLHEKSGACVISSVTGTISSITPFIGDFSKIFTAIAIDVDQEEIIDQQFEGLCQEPTLETLKNFFSFVPGAPPLKDLCDSANPPKSIIIYGGDTDLLISTNLYYVKADIKAIKAGIKILKQTTGIENIILAMPGESLQGYGHLGASVKNVSSVYPFGSPNLITQKILKQVVPAGKDPMDLGICFIRAEAVAAIGNAFTNGCLPVNKILTLVDKTGKQKLMSVRIGTPLKEIFNHYNINLNDRDRLIIGGPMTGSAVYSEDFPVQPDTDAVMVQDAADISHTSDYPCINCGDCIRICPAKIQVSMLVRLLEAELYEEAADEYDLMSCIDCGLCSYVCVAKIPVFQYIRLAKYELAKAALEEAENQEQEEETNE